MSSTQTLAWERVFDVADSAFSVWSGQPELRWAEEAWDILTHAGLTAYESTLDYGRVCCRFFAVASLYLDFCFVACQEDIEPSYSEWAEMMELHPFFVGQLVGPSEDYADRHGDPNLDDALRWLANGERKKVFDALLAHYGNATTFFIALERTLSRDQVGLINEDDDKEQRVTDWELVNDITFTEVDVFSWLTEGCQPLMRW